MIRLPRANGECYWSIRPGYGVRVIKNEPEELGGFVFLETALVSADFHHRLPRLRLPQHPQNLLFTMTALADNTSPILLRSAAE